MLRTVRQARCLRGTRMLCGVPDARDELIRELQEKQRKCISALRPTRPTSFAFEQIHQRNLWDGVASEEECRRAVDAAKHAMRSACDTDGSEGRLFPPHVEEARPLLGDEGFQLFTDLRARVGEQVRETYGEVDEVANLVSWISGPYEADEASTEPEELKGYNWMRDTLSATYLPHVDKANVPEYDVSALLYLSTNRRDFTGGLFAFNDSDCDRLVEPTDGRLIAFCSGFDNLHQVRPVLTGERFVLSIWYSRNENNT